MAEMLLTRLKTLLADTQAERLRLNVRLAEIRVELETLVHRGPKRRKATLSALDAQLEKMELTRTTTTMGLTEVRCAEWCHRRPSYAQALTGEENVA